jgi:hypothetical protein
MCQSSLEVILYLFANMIQWQAQEAVLLLFTLQMGKWGTERFSDFLKASVCMWESQIWTLEVLL